MRRKTLSGAFWVMLIIAIFSAISNYVSAKVILKIQISRMKPIVVLFLVLWPMLLFAEALVYRGIRKKIVYRKYAWGHIFFTFVAFIIIPLIWISTINLLPYFVTKETMTLTTRFERNMELPVFWVSIILGHVFFIIVLRKTFAKTSVTTGEPETVNLLDDVLN